MKGIKVFTLIAFFVIIAVPMALFNFKSGAVSEVDNRKLAESPFSASADDSKRWTVRTEEYINDRIGLREQMMLGYSVINKYAFHMVAHPSYSYGKDNYIFGAGITTDTEYGEYEKAFSDMLKSMQAYCQQRKIPFAVMIDPSKASIYPDKVPSSINYTRERTDTLVKELKARGINVVDNIEELQKVKATGIEVFNKQYDANHWNYNGAFYGTQNCLKKLKTAIPAIHLNDPKEFNITEKTQKYLPTSRFPVNEKVPDYELKDPIKEVQGYSGLRMDKQYNTFKYFVNEKRKAEGCPKALVFQGSYMNIYGDKFFKNSFSEYIMVHGYQNSMDMPYYVGLFKPDCVIFEVAEYTIKDSFYSLSKMKGLKYNPPLSSVDISGASSRSLNYDSVAITKSGEVTTVEFKTKEKFDNVWITFESDYDMTKSENGYVTAVPTKEKDKPNVKMKVITQKDGQITVYS